MYKSLENYPKITRFVSGLSKPEDTFLCDEFINPDYGFGLHLEYFLANLDRLPNHDSILERLSYTAPLSMEISKAWGKWQIFRSAQSEVTTIYLIEKYFLGRVIEIVPVNKKPTPDLRIDLGQHDLLVEVKAQSGQQHGNKHPREKGLDSFDPKGEIDLRSWLFEEIISSRNGRPMKPKTLEAEDKGADILVAMTDYFNTIQDIKSQVSFMCPYNKYITKKSVEVENGNLLIAHFFQIQYLLDRNLNKLKEIWLYDESHLERFVVLSGNPMFLFNHLKNTR